MNTHAPKDRIFTAALFVKATNEINPKSINSETDQIKCCHLHVIEIQFSDHKELLLNTTGMDFTNIMLVQLQIQK